MDVLVYFDGMQQRVAQRTLALLAEKFVFDADLLVHSPISNIEAWQVVTKGRVRELRAHAPFEVAVAEACAAKHYNLVVAAPNDRRGLVRMVLGSRIGRFISAAPATIWVPRGEYVQLKRIVVGISGGPQSEQDARLAARLAMAFDARLELVLVVSQLPLFFTTLGEIYEARENDSALAAMAPGVVELRRIHELLQKMGVKVEMLVRSGTVTDELVTVCNGYGKKPPADLLVIGAHAPNTYAGTDYLENLAEDIVVSAPCSTLIVHANSEWKEWDAAAQNRAQQASSG